MSAPRALARSTDPQTSREAADHAENTGKAQSQRMVCLREVTVHPNQTAAEIAAAIGLERHIPSRRLPELRDAGLVVTGPARRCTIQGTRSMTWSPPAQPDLFRQ